MAEVTLSPRQAEILWLASQGETGNGIANKLGISWHTVMNTLRTTYIKLGARSQSNAVYLACQRGLLCPPQEMNR